MWTSEFWSDPTHDYRLYLELLEDDEFRGRIELDDAGQPILTVYPSKEFVRIPGDWLMAILRGAAKDLPEWNP